MALSYFDLVGLGGLSRPQLVVQKLPPQFLGAANRIAIETAIEPLSENHQPPVAARVHSVKKAKARRARPQRNLAQGGPVSLHVTAFNPAPRPGCTAPLPYVPKIDEAFQPR